MNDIHRLFKANCTTYGDGQYGPKEGRVLNKAFLNEFATGSKLEKKKASATASLASTPQRRLLFGFIDINEPEPDKPYHGVVVGGTPGVLDTYVKLVNKRVDSRRKGVPQMVQMYKFGNQPGETLKKSRSKPTRWRLCDVSELKEGKMYLSTLAWFSVALGITPEDVEENNEYTFAIEQALALLSLASSFKEAQEKDAHMRAVLKKQPHVAKTLAVAHMAFKKGVVSFHDDKIVSTDCSAYEQEYDIVVEDGFGNKRRRVSVSAAKKVLLPAHLADNVQGLDVITCREYLLQAREDVMNLKRYRDMYKKHLRQLVREDLKTVVTSEVDEDDEEQEDEAEASDDE